MGNPNELAADSEGRDPSTLRFKRRLRSVPGLGDFVANEAGRFFLDARPTRHRPPANEPSPLIEFEIAHGFAASASDRLALQSHRGRTFARRAEAGPLDYLILVPTLRCNLACSYCQVSRAALGAAGFDWTESTATATERMFDGLETDSVKVEFQGGEPTLRLDLIERIVARCERFASRSIVICTNLLEISPDLMRLLERPDVSISTSLDGDRLIHSHQRTQTDEVTDRFFNNLEMILARFGPSRVSALPTVNQTNPPAADELIDAYVRYDISSIHLRPINFQGFARKQHPDSADDHTGWWDYHEAFVRKLIERNFSDRSRVLEESYLSLCLRRMFRIGLDRHVDLRNPSPLGFDYLVVDYDGQLYPTDEARMLARSGVIDLSLGDVRQGIDAERRALLNGHSTSIGDPACDACPYQPFCGRDIVDDLSRYGRIDLPRHQTFFCQKQMRLFDLCVRLIYSEDPAIRYSLARWLDLSGEYLPAQPQLA
ncbi:radical SAM protein [Novosphingobium sp. G106]|uniref:radical SAM protein n=1 Tax=Novosphingobium sp. G106 TaxID=2849500 RepID=UPI001C2D2592|nr:radical SAM protein [Novosphingobium sp. G106]MBV1691415.1 radical SAM protein [Novosphingobium sp. G106]